MSKESHTGSATSNPAFFIKKNYSFLKDFLKDIVLLYLLITGIEYLFLEPGTLNSISPHPFWIPVILVSSQYGTLPGMFSAITGIIIIKMTGGLPVPDNADYYQGIMHQWGQPVMWFIAVIFLGERRNTTLDKLTELRESISFLQLQNRTITGYCDTLQDTNGTLEHRIAIHDKDHSTRILRKLSEIRDIPFEQAEARLPVIMKDLFGAPEFTLYIKTGSGFDKISFARNESPEKTILHSGTALPGDIPDYIEVITRTRNSLSILDPDDARLLENKALFAAPVLWTDKANQKSTVAAILSIEMLDADRINDNTRLLCQIVCSQLAPVMAPVMENTIKKLETDKTPVNNSSVMAAASSARRPSGIISRN